MKKILFLLLLACVFQTGIAQVTPSAVPTYDTTAFQGKADYYLQNLDKTQIPTQILYDRVFPFARLDVFNQGTSDTSSYGHFMQALSELNGGSYKQCHQRAAHRRCGSAGNAAALSSKSAHQHCALPLQLDRHLCTAK